MQINPTLKKYLIGIFVVIALVSLWLFYKQDKTQTTIKTNTLNCPEAEPLAQQAALAWGNTEDQLSADYQNGFKKYLSSNLQQAFSQEWLSLDDGSGTQPSSLKITSIACSQEKSGALVRILGQKGDKYIPNEQIQINVRVESLNNQPLVTGFENIYSQ